MGGWSDSDYNASHCSSLTLFKVLEQPFSILMQVGGWGLLTGSELGNKKNSHFDFLRRKVTSGREYITHYGQWKIFDGRQISIEDDV